MKYFLVVFSFFSDSDFLNYQETATEIPFTYDCQDFDGALLLRIALDERNLSEISFERTS